MKFGDAPSTEAGAIEHAATAADREASEAGALPDAHTQQPVVDYATLTAAANAEERRKRNKRKSEAKRTKRSQNQVQVEPATEQVAPTAAAAIDWDLTGALNVPAAPTLSEWLPEVPKEANVPAAPTLSDWLPEVPEEDKSIWWKLPEEDEMERPLDECKDEPKMEQNEDETVDTSDTSTSGKELKIPSHWADFGYVTASDGNTYHKWCDFDTGQAFVVDGEGRLFEVNHRWQLIGTDISVPPTHWLLEDILFTLSSRHIAIILC